MTLACTAHHFPKLRSYFAEFLRYHFLNRLSIQCWPTCVGFQYGFTDLFSRLASYVKSFSVFNDIAVKTEGVPVYAGAVIIN
jgi:hypothetical protein